MMRLNPTLLAGLAVIALSSACSPRQAPEAAPSPVANEAQEQGICGAEKLAGFVGSLPSTDMLDEIKSKAGARTVRVVGPGDAMTMDFRPDRLTIELGENGAIKRFRCV